LSPEEVAAVRGRREAAAAASGSQPPPQPAAPRQQQQPPPPVVNPEHAAACQEIRLAASQILRDVSALTAAICQPPRTNPESAALPSHLADLLLPRPPRLVAGATHRSWGAGRPPPPAGPLGLLAELVPAPLHLGPAPPADQDDSPGAAAPSVRLLMSRLRRVLDGGPAASAPRRAGGPPQPSAAAAVVWPLGGVGPAGQQVAAELARLCAAHGLGDCGRLAAALGTTVGAVCGGDGGGGAGVCAVCWRGGSRAGAPPLLCGACALAVHAACLMQPLQRGAARAARKGVWWACPWCCGADPRLRDGPVDDRVGGGAAGPAVAPGPSTPVPLFAAPTAGAGVAAPRQPQPAQPQPQPKRRKQHHPQRQLMQPELQPRPQPPWQEEQPHWQAEQLRPEEVRWLHMRMGAPTLHSPLAAAAGVRQAAADEAHASDEAAADLDAGQLAGEQALGGASPELQQQQAPAGGDQPAPPQPPPEPEPAPEPTPTPAQPAAAHLAPQQLVPATAGTGALTGEELAEPPPQAPLGVQEQLPGPGSSGSPSGSRFGAPPEDQQQMPPPPVPGAPNAAPAAPAPPHTSATSAAAAMAPPARRPRRAASSAATALRSRMTVLECALAGKEGLEADLRRALVVLVDAFLKDLMTAAASSGPPPAAGGAAGGGSQAGGLSSQAGGRSKADAEELDALIGEYGLALALAAAENRLMGVEELRRTIVRVEDSRGDLRRDCSL
jgi:hypothetical protein